jgi:hypothetical protein
MDYCATVRNNSYCAPECVCVRNNSYCAPESADYADAEVAGLEALAGEVPPLPAKASSPLFIIHYSLFIKSSWRVYSHVTQTKRLLRLR